MMMGMHALLLFFDAYREGMVMKYKVADDFLMIR
jgi:hypothetical protein